MNRAKVLVVDDDAFFRTVCTDILKTGGYSVKTASSGSEAVGLVESEPFDIVVTDLVMPDIGGIEVLRRTKQHNALIDVIVVTGHGSIESAIEALKSGATDYIRKPVNEDELLHTVSACEEKKKLLEENIEMKQSLRLFEVSRAVATTIDINKLYSVTLDALLQMLPSEAGICAFYRDDMETLDIRGVRHVSISAAEKALISFSEPGGVEKGIKGLKDVSVTGTPESLAEAGEPLDDCRAMLTAPVVRGGRTIGYFLVYSRIDKAAFSQRDVKNAAFIAEHAAEAFENAQKYLDAKEMAFIDSLTNLYNSKYLETALEREIKRADRLMLPLTVFFIDLDNFKNVNDTNDHLAGSKVLVEVGKILLKCVREVDTVIRYGGDEYVVVLVDADYDVALKVAERIRASIEANRFLAEDGLDIRVTASIGVATYPLHARGKDELLKTADKAMYRAKDISKNTVFLAPVPEGQAPAARPGAPASPQKN